MKLSPAAPALLAVTALALLALTGCGGPVSPEDANSWRIAYVQDPKTGHEVRCAVNDYSDKSGVSCDWATTK